MQCDFATYLQERGGFDCSYPGTWAWPRDPGSTRLLHIVPKQALSKHMCLGTWSWQEGPDKAESFPLAQSALGQGAGTCCSCRVVFSSGLHSSVAAAQQPAPPYITGSLAVMSAVWNLPADRPLFLGLLIALGEPWLQPLLCPSGSGLRAQDAAKPTPWIRSSSEIGVLHCPCPHPP